MELPIGQSDVTGVVDDDIAVGDLDPRLFRAVKEPQVEASVLAFQLCKARREANHRLNLRHSADELLECLGLLDEQTMESRSALARFVNAVVVCLTDGSDERSDRSIISHSFSSSIGDGCGDCQPIEEGAEID